MRASHYGLNGKPLCGKKGVHPFAVNAYSANCKACQDLRPKGRSANIGLKLTPLKAES